VLLLELDLVRERDRLRDLVVGGGPDVDAGRLLELVEDLLRVLDVERAVDGDLAPLVAAAGEQAEQADQQRPGEGGGGERRDATGR
jgi:hypothetical protein